ncbi:rhodanese-like domain-containing protein [Methanobrevibacter sp.]|uniref:rhodanese-like domain-containing protein n=1 Tax=Methanobrevibacter sp. TaxID=66852 RepID=UPI0025E3969D|nr:rhodanese-like domain-containing protein [Methanobrevibacter sp.]
MENSINIPHSELTYNLEQLDNAKEIIVYYKTGERSDDTTEELISWGYEAFSLEGGFNQYWEYVKNLMAVELDVKGQLCPGPIIQIADI